jgi:hypothetical protein
MMERAVSPPRARPSSAPRSPSHAARSLLAPGPGPGAAGGGGLGGPAPALSALSSTLPTRDMRPNDILHKLFTYHGIRIPYQCVGAWGVCVLCVVCVVVSVCVASLVCVVCVVPVCVWGGGGSTATRGWVGVWLSCMGLACPLDAHSPLPSTPPPLPPHAGLGVLGLHLLSLACVSATGLHPPPPLMPSSSSCHFVRYFYQPKSFIPLRYLDLTVWRDQADDMLLGILARCVLLAPLGPPALCSCHVVHPMVSPDPHHPSPPPLAAGPCAARAVMLCRCADCHSLFPPLYTHPLFLLPSPPPHPTRGYLHGRCDGHTRVATRLTLTDCALVTDAGVTQLLPTMVAMTSLEAVRCRITDASLLCLTTLTTAPPPTRPGDVVAARSRSPSPSRRSISPVRGAGGPVTAAENVTWWGCGYPCRPRPLSLPPPPPPCRPFVCPLAPPPARHHPLPPVTRSTLTVNVWVGLARAALILRARAVCLPVCA